MPTAVIVSFRLGGADGVSIEAAKWADSIRRLGWGVVTVAGAGQADRLLPGLAIEAPVPPTRRELEEAWGSADLVIVENLCSLPLNPHAASAVAGTLAGRAALFRHHDLPWQRSRFVDRWFPIADDPAWQHVTINDLSRRQLAFRGIEAVTIRNAFDTEAPAGDRDATRAALGIEEHECLVLQPTRAIARKNIPAALSIAEALKATYWLLGEPEEGYGPELVALLGDARVRCIHGPGPTTAKADVAQAYAAADLVVFPSTWEGFGNPVVESAVHLRPLAIGRYPVAGELAAFGFRWLPAGCPTRVAEWMERPDPMVLDENLRVARSRFSLAVLDDALSPVLDKAISGRPLGTPNVTVR